MAWLRSEARGCDLWQATESSGWHRAPEDEKRYPRVVRVLLKCHQRQVFDDHLWGICTPCPWSCLNLQTFGTWGTARSRHRWGTRPWWGSGTHPSGSAGSSSSRPRRSPLLASASELLLLFLQYSVVSLELRSVWHKLSSNKSQYNLWQRTSCYPRCWFCLCECHLWLAEMTSWVGGWRPRWNPASKICDLGPWPPC